MEQTFEDFIEKYLLQIKFKEVETDPEKAWVPGVRTYKVKVKSPGFDKSLKIEFRCGPDAGEPTIEGVLQCVQSDSGATEYCSDKWGFIKEFGYDDPQEGERVYLACLEQREKAIRYFGYVVFEELMSCTEM